MYYLLKGLYVVREMIIAAFLENNPCTHADDIHFQETNLQKEAFVQLLSVLHASDDIIRNRELISYPDNSRLRLIPAVNCCCCIIHRVSTVLPGKRTPHSVRSATDENGSRCGSPKAYIHTVSDYCRITQQHYCTNPQHEHREQPAVMIQKKTCRKPTMKTNHVKNPAGLPL